MSLGIDGAPTLSTKAERKTSYGGLTMWQFLDLKAELERAERNFGLGLKVVSTLVKPMTETAAVISTVDFIAQKNMMK